MTTVPELDRVVRPDGGWEVRVSEKVEAVLLSKISRKARRVRVESERLRVATVDFRSAFDGGRVAELGGVLTYSRSLAEVHREWAQVMDVAEQCRLDLGLIEEACADSAPVPSPSYRWGVPE